jgi:hypothetical protein
MNESVRARIGPVFIVKRYYYRRRRRRSDDEAKWGARGGAVCWLCPKQNNSNYNLKKKKAKFRAVHESESSPHNCLALLRSNID